MSGSLTEEKAYAMGFQEAAVSYFEGQEEMESLKRVESARSHVLDDSEKSEGISFDALPIIDVTPEDNRRVLRKLDCASYLSPYY